MLTEIYIVHRLFSQDCTSPPEQLGPEGLLGQLRVRNALQLGETHQPVNLCPSVKPGGVVTAGLRSFELLGPDWIQLYREGDLHEVVEFGQKDQQRPLSGSTYLLQDTTGMYILFCNISRIYLLSSLIGSC